MESEELRTTVDALQSLSLKEGLENSEHQGLSAQQLHPLLIPKVLGQVLRHVSFSSLLECRSVCLLWEEEATFHLRQHPCNIIPIPFSGQWVPKWLETYNIDKLKYLKNCVNKSWNWPITRMKYYGVVTTPGGNTRDELCQAVRSVLKSISPWITELTLQYNRDLFNVSFAKIQFPVLKKLFLSFFTTVLSKDHAKLKQLLHQVLKNKPDMHTIEIYEGSGFTDVTNWFLIPILTSYGLKSLSCFSIRANIGNLHLLQIGELNLQIQVLELQFTRKLKENFESALNTLLTMLAGSLVSLKLMFYYEAVHSAYLRVSHAFPKLKRLETLEINSNYWELPLPHISFEGFFFEEKTPNLKILLVPTENLSVLTKRCTNLQELHLSGVEPSDILYNGLSIFPNVNYLKVPILHLSSVCTHWTRVEQLELDIWQYTDNWNHFVVGLAHEKWLDLETRYENGEAIENIEREYSCMEIGHTLTRLKQLKTLKLNFGPERESVSISKLMCELVFLKMESLQRLIFGGSRLSSKEISDELLERMRKKFRVIFT